MTYQAPWTTGRDSLLRAIDDGRPLSFCWDVLQVIAGLYQTATGVAFLAMPKYDRREMRDWLAAL